MIVQEDVPYTKEEVKAMVKTIHNLREQLEQLGWHQGSELPPVDDAGDSEWLVVILMNNEILLASYNSRHEGWYREDGSKIYGIIKRWCYQPKED